MAGLNSKPPALSVAQASEHVHGEEFLHPVRRNRKLLWLDKNENIDPKLAALTTRILSEIDPIAIYTYPEFHAIYEKLSHHLGVAVDRLVLTAGSDFAIRSVFEAFVRSGDVVVHTFPTYAMYPFYADLYGAETVRLDYSVSQDGPRLEALRVIEMISRVRPKLVCLPNPDSPTGTVFDPDAMRHIIETAERFGSLILVG